MRKKERKGIPLTLIYSILALASFVLAGSVVAGSLITRRGYEEINRLTDGYLGCADDILELDETSDFLTERCREYVAIGSPDSVHRYVMEIAESKSRENALEHFSTFFANTEIYADLSSALDNSNKLAEQELYAMRLSADYHGIESVPTQIQQVKLLPDDASLGADQKWQKANELVFGDSYLELKDKIDELIRSCLNGLIEVTSARKQAANESITATMIFHDVAGWVLLGMLVTVAVSTWLLVLRPLRKTKEAIDAEKRIEVSGSREIRYVSNAYNHVYDENERKKEILLYEVGHDILTGIPNRHDYVETCNRYANKNILFIIADVDRFKSINDTTGHAMGDNVLTEVARRLRESFLNHDRVFRIGGDEFVVMVFDATAERKNELKGILDGINTTLRDISKAQPHFPQVSLSFGVAEKTCDMTFEAVYRLADQALYSVKKAGGCGVAFDTGFQGK